MALNSGIYQILNTETNERYVGSTKNTTSRKASHLYDLRHNKNKHPKLQKAYDKYGEESFVFLVLEYVQTNKKRLLEREQFWIDFLNPEYNENKIVGSVIPRSARTKEAKGKISKTVKQLWEDGYYDHLKGAERVFKAGHAPNLGRDFSKEWRENISKSMRGEDNHNYGKPRPQSFIDKMAKTHSGAISPDGEIFAPIVNMNKFCKEHNLDSGSMTRLMQGKQKSSKGWVKFEG